MSQQSYRTQTLITDETIEEIVDCSITEDKELYEFYNNQKTHVLFVFHVPENIIDDQLYELFVRYGALKATVMTHEDSGRSRGFGFVHFASRYQAQIAINAMDGFEVGYKRLRVAFKKEHSHKAKSKMKQNINIRYLKIR